MIISAITDQLFVPKELSLPFDPLSKASISDTGRVAARESKPEK